jgi:hypothetical protein
VVQQELEHLLLHLLVFGVCWMAGQSETGLAALAVLLAVVVVANADWDPWTATKL